MAGLGFFLNMVDVICCFLSVKRAACTQFLFGVAFNWNLVLAAVRSPMRIDLFVRAMTLGFNCFSVGSKGLSLFRKGSSVDSPLGERKSVC